jgi:hypothetical protein
MPAIIERFFTCGAELKPFTFECRDRPWGTRKIAGSHRTSIDGNVHEAVSLTVGM